MLIAQIDLDSGAAEFLLSHARHHVLVAFISALALVTLSIYAVWVDRKNHLLEQQQLRLRHLAHLGEMSAGLAHEIRNPLGTIKGFAQLLAEPAHAKRDLIDPIISETLRLEALVNDLLHFGRPPQPVIRQVEWQAIEDWLCVHSGARPGRIIRSGEQLTLRTDPNLLEQALLNLLRNALEATENSVEMRLKREENGKKLLVSILDDGPGLPRETRKHLFEPFYTTKALGTGLGLSISKKLVQSLGGEIELRDRQPNGTEAVVLLPAGD
jgi:two-component system sensor histidine kinase HydH